MQKIIISSPFHKIFICFTILQSFTFSTNAQKKIVDIHSYNNWPSIEPSQYPLSSSGNFVLYNLTKGLSSTSIIASTHNDWTYLVDKGSIQFVTYRSNEYAIIQNNDSSYLLNLNNHEKINFSITKKIESNGAFLNYRKNDNASCLAYTDKFSNLKILDLSNMKSFSIGKVLDFRFTEDGNFLFALLQNDTVASKSAHLQVININQLGSSINISLDEKIQQLNLITKTGQFYYLFNPSSSQDNNEFYLYRINPKSKSIKKIFSSALLRARYPGNNLADDYYQITPDNKKILFHLASSKKRILMTNNSPATIWSYLDKDAPSNLNKDQTYSYLSIYDLESNALQILENDSTMLLANSTGNWIMFGTHPEIRSSTYNQGYDGRDIRRYGYSLIDGKRIDIPISRKGNYDLFGIRNELSPNSTKSIYYSYDANTYYVVDFPTGRVIDLKCPSDLDLAEMEREHSFISRVAGWSPDNDTVYLYSRRDIWMASTKGEFPGVNITNGYGQLHNIKFNFLSESKIIDLKRDTFLIAFDINTKENGFYKLQANSAPSLLSMHSKLFYSERTIPQLAVRGEAPQIRPSKAMNSDMYVVSAESATESRNYFVTQDFINFKRVTDNHPEKDYNWLTTQLFEWNMTPDKKMQGVLYLPENFDAIKKYPVLVYCYELMSDGLNGYIPPQDLVSGCVINIPTYVSNGYIVFCPDLYMPKGNTLAGAALSIKTGVEKLRFLSYIDSTRIGIQGCSFGGLVTDFVVTQTELFKAACAASGIANPISVSNAMDGRDVPNIDFFIGGQVRMGNLWENKQGYINNTAILYADKVTTPLLLMHTTGDRSCPLYDAVQYFNALKYNNKKVWMLQYNGSHGIYGSDGEDFATRMRDFFDYFLKDKGEPRWITEPIYK
ncbi:alpha/beta hydrolase family protein [Chitinophaga sp. Hz27]|uniref:alpha/beta hydrolase family protein n=1 Tax=Chitinophaga sp. Hz27 TaxID=3347169 RepID=UPI0035DF2A58